MQLQQLKMIPNYVDFFPSCEQSGPVLRLGQSFMLQPDSLPAVQVDSILQILDGTNLSLN